MTDTLSHRSRRSLPRLAAIGLTTLALAVGFVGGRESLVASSPAAAPATVTTPAPERAPVSSYSGIVDRVAPAVVTVRVDRKAEASPANLPEGFEQFFGPRFRMEPRGGGRERGLGSGVVVRQDGYILTNHHVVGGADRIQVEFADGRSLAARLVGSDAASDLAVIQVTATDLPTVPYGDSDSARVGDVVLAFGNPLGIGQTVTMGIVSAKGRTTGVGDGSYEDFLQTDAPINRGNSGGALVNLQGELVGINAQIVSPSGGSIGLGFAIPSAMARSVADQLIQDGVVHRAKLGVTVQPLTPALAESLGVAQTRGAVIGQVEPGSPAERAGLMQGDVIAELDGHPVVDANALRNQIANARPGSAVKMTVIRDGRPLTVSANLVARETGAVARNERGASGAGAESRYGMTVAPITPDVAREMDLARSASGLVVTSVDPDGPAAEAGIQPGDVVKSVNGRQVTTAPALRDALAARSDRPSLVLVNRKGAELFVALSRGNS